MILLLDHQVVILTPPKTASDSLHRYFCSGPPWNGLALVSQHHGTLDKHGMRPPNEAVGCRVLLVVRHPLERLVSLWHHKCRVNAYDGRGSGSFADYAAAVARRTEVTWIWRSTITELLGDQPFDGVVRCEALRETLAGHGLECGELPRVNESYRRPWQEYYTPELLQTVRPWAAADALRFGYE